MHGHVSAGILFAVTSYSCKVNTMVFVVLLQVRKVNFYSASSLLALQTAVIAITILSVRLPVCPSVTFGVLSRRMKIRSFVCSLR